MLSRDPDVRSRGRRSVASTHNPVSAGWWVMVLRNRQAVRAAISAVFLALGSCSEPSATDGESCATHEDCEGSSLCIGGVCRRSCNFDADCEPADSCGSGFCQRIHDECQSHDQCAGPAAACAGRISATCLGGQCQCGACAADGACGLDDGEACSGDINCANGHCVCADTSCSQRVCHAAACACGYVADDACAGPLADGVDDPGFCDGERSCYQATCVLDLGVACSDDGQCASLQCECTNSTCTEKVCASDSCACRFGTRGTCVQPVQDGAHDPLDCPTACQGGVCAAALGSACGPETPCLDSQCECANSDCSAGVCVNDDCVCRFGPGGNCTTDLADGAVDFGDCDGEFACYGGACLSIVGSACSENPACGSSHCECVDLDCHEKVCAATQCTCGYGPGGSCDHHLSNGASDPEDCDQPGRVCWNGACLLEQDETCDTSEQCVSDSCLNRVCLPNVCDAAAMAAMPYSGSGTADDPYLLCTAQQLQSIQEADLGSVFHLGSDIDLGGYDGQGGNPAFVPIGLSLSFTGTFDGRGYEIANLTSQAGGLFDDLSGSGTIRNLDLIDATVTGTGGELGMLVNTMSSASARVEICRVDGEITGSGEVGGLVGESDGTLQDCHVAGSVVSEGGGYHVVGGMVGRASPYAVIYGCSADVAVRSVAYSVGGLVGENSGEILGGHAAGPVYASDGTYAAVAGGLVGNNVGWGKVLRSYATGSVETDGVGGGLVGAMSDAPEVADSYATGQVTCVAACGGLVGSSGGAISRSYATGHVFGPTDTTGGLVGENTEQILDSFAVGLVETPGPTGYGVSKNASTYSAGMLNCFWYDASMADDAHECNEDGDPAGVCELVTELSALIDPGHEVYTRTDAAWDFTNNWVSHANALPTLRP